MPKEDCLRTDDKCDPDIVPILKKKPSKCLICCLKVQFHIFSNKNIMKKLPSGNRMYSKRHTPI